jgi:hypothetical protein
MLAAMAAVDNIISASQSKENIWDINAPRQISRRKSRSKTRKFH